MTNKKAMLGNQLMVFMFLFIIIVIMGGLVAGNYIFFGKGYETRKSESQILNNVVYECLSSQKNLDPYSGQEALEKEIIELCSLNLNSLNSGYLIYLSDAETGKQLLRMGSGDPTNCALSGRNENFPICTEKTISLNGVEIKLLTGANQKPEVLR